MLTSTTRSQIGRLTTMFRKSNQSFTTNKKDRRSCLFSSLPITKNISSTSPSSSSMITKASVKLKEIPTLPYLGSIIPQYSNIPSFDHDSPLSFWPEVRRRHGDFYKIGLPGFGVGRDGILFVINDPYEMMKVLQQEKTSRLPYPMGVVQIEWPLIRYLNGINSKLTEVKASTTSDSSSMEERIHDENGFFGRGESWKHYRSFMQTDLLSPQSSKRFIPAMTQAAQIASQAVPQSKTNLNEYFHRCAFDMFNSLMFGELTKTADLSIANEENVLFCENAVKTMTTMIHQLKNPYEQIVGLHFGVRTSTFMEMCNACEQVFATAESKYHSFRRKYENYYTSLTDLERNSYLGQAIVRQMESNGKYTEEDLAEIVKIMLSAAVDTTSSPMSWNLYHVAVNQDVQSKLYDELQTVFAKEGEINENFLHPNTTPYLHAVVRESHRITPATPVPLAKENSLHDVEIHGTTIPKNSKIMFDSYSLGVDPKMMENPLEFNPERWLDAAVGSRKGTPAEILDHPFFKTPFSHGSRKCPGSRVAQNEILILLSQIVLDWKVTAPPHVKGFEDMESTMSGLVVPKMPTLEFEQRL